MDIERVILGDHDPMRDKGSDDERAADNDDSGPEDTEYKYYKEMKAYEEKLNRSKTPPPLRKFGHNCGPKGVLADYYEDLERKRIEREIEKEERNELIHNMTCGVSTNEASVSYAATHTAISEMLLHENDKIYNCDKENETDDEDNIEDDDDDDDNFLKKYREKRLTELQSKPFKKYGTLDLVTPIKLLEIIDDKENDTFVIVHLIDRYTTDSVYCHNLLLELCKKFEYVRFVEVYGHQALKSFNPVGCPLINVYKKGELYKCFVKITEKLGYDYSVDDLENFFESYIYYVIYYRNDIKLDY